MPTNVALRQLLTGDPIVITGEGAVTRFGAGAEPLWQAIGDCLRGGDWLHFATPAGEHRVAAASAGDLPAHPLRGKVDRSVLMALMAGTEAWAQAGGPGIAPPEEVAVVAGTSRGPSHVWSAIEKNLQSSRRLPPRLAVSGTLASLSGAIAQATGALGPGHTVSATCASGANALVAAAEMLLLGKARAVIAGGADAPLTPGVLLGMESAGLLAHHDLDPSLACRPFDRDRNGLLPGEGAAFFVLERKSHATARGARILGTLAGWATATDGEGRAGVAADGHALHRVMQQALDLAGLAPWKIQYVNTHGTGTPLNDRAEATALRRLFGPAIPPLSSTKAITGHCLGASPAIETLLCLRALREGFLPAAVNTFHPCFDLPFIPEPGLSCHATHALSTSLGFWGYHAALVFSAG